MSQMYLYPQYEKRYAVRMPNHLTQPRLFPLSLMSLPRNSILHYLSESEAEYGPASDEALLLNVPRLVLVSHLTALSSSEGNPRSTYVQPGPLIQDYRRRYRKLRPLNKLELADREPQNVLVYNYAMLPHLVKYTRSFFSRYYAWLNVQNTMYNNINELATQTQRHHFIQLILPPVIPGLNALRKAEKTKTRDALEPFVTNDQLSLLDLWTFLGVNRQNSSLSHVKPEYLSRINFIIRHQGAWLTINMGVLETWRKNPNIERDAGVDPKTFQIRFLRMISTLHEAGGVVGDKPPVEVVEQEPVAVADTPVIEIDVTPEPTHAEIQDQLDELDVPPDEEELAELNVIENLNRPEEVIEHEEEFDEDGNQVGKAAPMTEGSQPVIIGTIRPNVVRTHEGAIQAKVDELADAGVISGGDYRRLMKNAEAYKNLKDPYGSGQSFAEALVIKKEDLILKDVEPFPDDANILDKSMLKSTVADMDRQYIPKILPKDIMGMVMMTQQAGVAVTGYEIERVTDAVSDFEIHSVSVTPVVGRQSTLRFRVPVVQPEGTYISNGVRYRLKKQRADLPIRKVSPTRVGLSSYYGKVFVDKSDRKVFDYDRWISNLVVAKGLDPSDTTITDIRVSDVSDDTKKLPRIYSIISSRISSFKSKGVDYWFDYANRAASGLFTIPELKAAEQGGLVAVGRRGHDIIVVDMNDVFYVYGQAGGMKVLGRLEEILEIDATQAKTPMAEFKIFGKTIPVGVVLGYLIGFQGLLTMIGARPRRVPNGERLNLAPDEWVLRFLDESLVFAKDDVKTSLILSGFNMYQNVLRNYSVKSFDRKDIYLNVLDSYGIGVRYLRELDLINAMFVDPITKTILEWMNEPTDFVGLMVRASEMLVTRHVPQRVEGAEGFIDSMELSRGYERFAGAVYTEIIKSLRVYNSRNATSAASLSMNPHAVWTTIVQDPAAGLVDDINPVHNLKEKELITFGGRGGRSHRSMVAETRLYQESDKGFISEATVDSGAVAIITYMSPNANFTSVRGTVRGYNEKIDGASTLLSTTALLAPQADRDDPKRVNFIGIQQSHGVAAVGYRPSPLRTGYEQILAHRTDGLFASAAPFNGTVTELTDTSIRVQYEDGSTQSYEIGRRFGTSVGTTLPNTLTTGFKLGDKVNKGDIVAYNSGFFEPLYFNPKQVAWKAGVMAKTALLEAVYTLEDSSAITQELADALATQVTKVKVIKLKFDQSVRNLVQIGDQMDLETILCTIEDSVTARADLFDERSLDTLRLLSAMTPKAKTVGVVEKIEVFYHGDFEDMSESLQSLATIGDKDRRRTAKRLGKPSVTGSVDQSLRIDGEGLDLDHMAIKVYITGTVSAGIGDKAVFGNQMKTVFGRILTGVHETVSGVKVDAIFGYKSIQDRIVLSPLIIGTTNTLLRVIGENAADIFFNE